MLHQKNGILKAVNREVVMEATAVGPFHIAPQRKQCPGIWASMMLHQVNMCSIPEAVYSHAWLACYMHRGHNPRTRLSLLGAWLCHHYAQAASTHPFMANHGALDV